MTRTEHLLWILAEECAEIAHRASKAARFGLQEVQPGQGKTNAERLVDELADISGVVRMLVNAGCIASVNSMAFYLASKAKEEKVEKFLKYSAECGTLRETSESERAA